MLLTRGHFAQNHCFEEEILFVVSSKGDSKIAPTDVGPKRLIHIQLSVIGSQTGNRQKQKIIVNRIWFPVFLLPLQIASFACIAAKSSPPLPFSPSWQMQYISRNYGKISLVSERGGIYLAPSHGGRRRRESHNCCFSFYETSIGFAAHVQLKPS